MRDGSSFDLRTLPDHTFFCSAFWASQACGSLFVEVAAEEQDVPGAEAVAGGVNTSSVGHGVCEFLFDGGYDAL